MKQTFAKRPHANLVQSILLAESEEQINGLLSLGETFDHASDKTRSRWHKAAKKRASELRAAR